MEKKSAARVEEQSSVEFEDNTLDSPVNSQVHQRHFFIVPESDQSRWRSFQVSLPFLQGTR